MFNLLIIAALIVALKVYLIWTNNPKLKGMRGEKIVASRLKAGLPPEYKLLNDIYLPLSDGTTTQIDHIVVSQYGIFVVETKNYSGWLFGDEKSTVWTQSLYQKKRTFQNPLRQNYLHICTLADALGINKSYFHNVVAFTGDCTFKTKMPRGVVYSKRAADYIRSINMPLIKPKQVDEIVSVITDWHTSLGEERIAAHVENLKKRHASSRN